MGLDHVAVRADREGAHAMTVLFLVVSLTVLFLALLTLDWDDEG